MSEQARMKRSFSGGSLTFLDCLLFDGAGIVNVSVAISVGGGNRELMGMRQELFKSLEMDVALF